LCNMTFPATFNFDKNIISKRVPSCHILQSRIQYAILIDTSRFIWDWPWRCTHTHLPGKTWSFPTANRADRIAIGVKVNNTIVVTLLQKCIFLYRQRHSNIIHVL
jgi:hypothetical protein